MADGSKIEWTEGEREMKEGYWDGFDPGSPEPGPNRSACYRHGFLNGRDDRRGRPRAPAAVIRAQAERLIDGRTWGERPEGVSPGAAEMFKLKKACKSCPFRRDAGHAFGFPEPRLREIVNGVAFQCHNTVDYDHWDEGAEARSGDHPQQCAGLMALLHKEGQPRKYDNAGSGTVGPFRPRRARYLAGLRQHQGSHRRARRPSEAGMKHQQFTEDMEAAGYEVKPYRGRNFYDGPSVRIDRAELQDVIRVTAVRLQTDQLGLGLVVYPT